ncbi:MAG: S9 family peptidase [Acidobacteriota bacterium]|nr:S9 family peptidase [Acidobacteriota bacterium]
MDRDLRQTALFGEVEEYFRSVHAPGQGVVTDGAGVDAAPDGSTVVFTGSIFETLESPPASRLCRVDLASGELTVLEAHGSHDRAARFSPDGKWIAFLSDGEEPGSCQLCLRGAEGSGACFATPRVEGVVEYIRWSPDGASVLLGVAGLGADLAGCEGGATTVKSADEVPLWMPRVETGDGENLWRSLWIFDLEPARLRPLPTPGLNPWEADWAGSHGVVAVVSESHSEASWYGSRLVAIHVDSGAITTLYEPAEQIGLPSGSSDGSRLAFVRAVCSDRLIVAGRLLIANRHDGGTVEIDTQHIDVTDLRWRGDHHIVFAGHRSFETVVAEVDLEAGSVVEHWSGEERTIGNWYPAIAALPEGGAVGVAEAWSVAPEISTFLNGDRRPVVSLESATDGRPDSLIEPVRWSARDELVIDGWLVRPVGSEGPSPLVMDIHGGPVWACRNRWHGRQRGAKLLVDKGYAVFYPNPRGSSCRGQQFARRVVGDMGGEDTWDYLTGIDALVERQIADPTRVGVTGISYGGFMSAWLITQDDRFAAAVPISPVTDWYSQHRTSQIGFFDELFLDASASEPGGRFFDRSPVMFADRVRCPTLVMAGETDQNTPPTQALEFHRSLLEAGVESVLSVYPTAAHGVRSFPEVIDATTRYVGWFLKHMR